jgi:hypothetical protein
LDFDGDKIADMVFDGSVLGVGGFGMVSATVFGEKAKDFDG